MTAKKPTKKAPAKVGASDWRDAESRGVEFSISDAEFERVSLSQKSWLAQLANQVEAGEPLQAHDREVAAGAIRAFADSIPLKQKRRRGQAAKFDHGSEAMVFVTLRVRGFTPTQAYVSIADRVGVEWQAVERQMRKHGPGAAQVLTRMGLKCIPDYLFRE